MDAETPRPLPVADEATGRRALSALLRERSLLPCLEVMFEALGGAFRITLPGFRPAVFAGPEANREILVTKRERLRWRTPTDPVARLLRRGLLVVDGEEHAELRALMEPALLRSTAIGQVGAMARITRDFVGRWEEGRRYDMLDEMRRLALLLLVETLFDRDFGPDMERVWKPLLRTLKYIAPGLWILRPGLPRPGYRRSLRAMDDYLYELVAERRAAMADGHVPPDSDLVGALIAAGLDDDRIRDQLLTMLIAGHDTSTALLAWSLQLLGAHPEAMAALQAELDEILDEGPITSAQVGRLAYLDQVLKEALRLYPPIHVGNRRVPEDTTIAGHEVCEGDRLMYSIFLTHRDPAHWEEPEAFCPARFDLGQRHERPALAYLPFGGGPRNCIGAAYARIEAKVVLAEVLRAFDLELETLRPRRWMGATLEPRPGVRMRLRRRRRPSTGADAEARAGSPA